MPANWIKKNLLRIDNTIQRLETSKSLYAYDDRCLSHLLRATLYRFLLEQEEEEEEEESEDIDDGISEEIFKDPEYIFDEEKEESEESLKQQKQPQQQQLQDNNKNKNKLNMDNNSSTKSVGRNKILKLLGHDELRKHHPYKVRHRHSIQLILEMADKIQLDHWIYYFAIYEKAQLLMMDELYADAKHELDYILRCTEKKDFHVGAGLRAKNKYSMENALILKCHSCLGYINEQATKGTMIGKKTNNLSSLLRYHHPTSSLKTSSSIIYKKKTSHANLRNESDILPGSSRHGSNSSTRGSGGTSTTATSSGFVLSPSTSLRRKQSL